MSAIPLVINITPLLIVRVLVDAQGKLPLARARHRVRDPVGAVVEVLDRHRVLRVRVSVRVRVRARVGVRVRVRVGVRSSRMGTTTQSHSKPPIAIP